MNNPSQITKEQAEAVFDLRAGYQLGNTDIDILRKLAEFALAAMGAEPAGYHVIKECGQVGCSVATFEEAQSTRDFWNKRWTIKPYFYAAPPAPVVPDEMPVHTGPREFGRPQAYVDGWNACRAAMLQSKAEPVSQPYKLPSNSFTDAEIEMMSHGDNPQANAYRELLAFRRNYR